MLVLVQAQVPPLAAPCDFVVEQGLQWNRGSAFVALSIPFDRAPWSMQRPVPKHRRKVVFPSQRHLRLHHQLPKRRRQSHLVFRQQDQVAVASKATIDVGPLLNLLGVSLGSVSIIKHRLSVSYSKLRSGARAPMNFVRRIIASQADECLPHQRQAADDTPTCRRSLGRKWLLTSISPDRHHHLLSSNISMSPPLLLQLLSCSSVRSHAWKPS